MLRMLIVGYCYGIRFERRLCEEVELHMSYCKKQAKTGIWANGVRPHFFCPYDRESDDVPLMAHRGLRGMPPIWSLLD
jgi:hypothetical protein